MVAKKTEFDIADIIDNEEDESEDIYVTGPSGSTYQVALLQQSGIVTSNVTPFNLSAEQVKRYNSYLNNVARSYSDDTAKAIRAVLERAELESLSAQQIRSNLKDIVKRSPIVTGKQIGRAHV